MKKIFILLAAILFGISASFSQVGIVNVNWNPDNCFSGTCGGQITDYFKITDQSMMTPTENGLCRAPPQLQF